MKVIVTGANGYVGSSLIKKLVENGIEVLAIDLSFANSHLPESKLIRKIESNLESVDEILSYVKENEYDLFYNFAWRGVNGPDKASYKVQLSNIELSLRCAELAKRIGCKKYLCAGTIAERTVESLHCLNKTSGGMMYGSAKHTTHIMLETYCKNIGLNFIWMQFSNIYGPNNKTGNLISYTINQLMKNEIASFGPAMQPYDFIYINDLIEAVYRLGINKTEENWYFIGSGHPRVLSKYLLKIGELMNKPHLINIGEREDDGIKYSYDMMDASKLKNDIGEYVSGTFDELIQYTISNY